MWLDYENESAAPETAQAFYLFVAPNGMPVRVEDLHGKAVGATRGGEALLALGQPWRVDHHRVELPPFVGEPAEHIEGIARLHRHVAADGPNGGGTYRREVAIDKLTFNSDGSIQKVTPSGGLRF